MFRRRLDGLTGLVGLGYTKKAVKSLSPFGDLDFTA